MHFNGSSPYIGVISLFTFVISKVDVFIVTSVWLISAAHSVRSTSLLESYQSQCCGRRVIRVNTEDHYLQLIYPSEHLYSAFISVSPPRGFCVL